ncbi:9935_t:CDS:2, partial [Entrophospora sp. SA101]
FNLYVLIQDHEGISRLCLSRSASIPTQYMDNSETIYEFIETLLLLRVVDDETKNHQQDYAKHEKMILPLRSSLQSVFSIRWFIFTIPPPVAKTHLHPSITIDFDGSLRGGKKPIS